MPSAGDRASSLRFGALLRGEGAYSDLSSYARLMLAAALSKWHGNERFRDHRKPADHIATLAGAR